MKFPDGWSGDEKRRAKCFRFSGFAAALAFMVEVGLYCERVDHHPEWKNIYDKVWVELTTHDAGGVTDKDLALAERMEAVYARYAA
jgi:4a-hydroxytetrahydrobiopterin dehydratase